MNESGMSNCAIDDRPARLLPFTQKEGKTCPETERNEVMATHRSMSELLVAFRLSLTARPRLWHLRF